MRDEDARRLAALIKDSERLRLFPYDDATGKPPATEGALTIGWGRNLTANGISEPEATCLFRRDLDAAMGDVLTFWPWAGALDPVRFAVVTDLVFNMGVSTVRQFKPTLAHLERGEYADVAAHLRASKWARQVGRRATRDIAMMVSGEWPEALR